MRIKKIFLAIVLMIAVILSSVPSFSNKYMEQRKVQLLDVATNSINQYYPINVVLRGKDLISDTPSFAESGRTLIPFVAFFDSFNLEYEYNPDKKTISFDSPKGKIVLTLGDTFALVNGKRTLLPDAVAPNVYAYRTAVDGWLYRTYIPLRFVSEIFNYEVDYVGDSRTATINYKTQKLTDVKIDYKKRYPEIRVKFSGKIDYSSIDLKASQVGAKDAIMVDFHSSILDIKGAENGKYVEEVPDEIFGIRAFNFEQVSLSPNKVRLTIERSQRRGYDIHFDEQTNEVVIRLLNSLDSYEVKKMYGADTLVLDTSINPLMNVTVKPKKIHIDLIDSVTKFGLGESKVSFGLIESLEFTKLSAKEKESMQYGDREVSRVTVNLKEEVDKKQLFAKRSDYMVQLFVASEVVNDFNYARINRESSELKIGTSSRSNPNVQYDSNTGKLSLKFGLNELKLEDFENKMIDGIIKSFGVTKTDTEYIVSSILDDHTTYDVVINDYDVTVKYLSNRIKESPYKNTLVVVDAGHGGYDPGAVGSKEHEKVLALRSSKRLQQMLEAEGFNVIMTRSDDNYVSLSDRAVIANSVNADLFVSVHINASESSKPNGIETLYGSSEEKVLATYIQKRMIKVSGATNRGVVWRPELYVIRKTNMTAVLCELGFISNAIEQDLLLQNDYLYKVTDAIKDGVKDYLDK